MCLEKNDVKPKTDVYYKVFCKRNKKLYWLIRDEKAKLTIGRKIVKKGFRVSTNEGFHVWKNISDANRFKDMVDKMYSSLKSNSFAFPKGTKSIVKKVKCKEFKRGGLCISGIKDMRNKDSKKILSCVICDKMTIKRQAFAYEKIEVI